MTTHSPLSSPLKRLSAESGRYVLSARFTASNFACAPARSASGEAGSGPANLIVHALPMVSPEIRVSPGIGGALAQAASTRPAAATIIRTRFKLLRQDFESGGVRSTTLLHARHRGLFVLQRGFEPVQARRRPGNGDLAILVRLESHLARRVAITSASRNDIDFQVRGRFAIDEKAELRSFAR